MRNHLQNFHIFDGMPCEAAQGNFEFCKHLSSTSDLGHIDLAVGFYQMYTLTISQADAASTKVLGVINWLAHYDLPDSQAHVQISELAALFRDKFALAACLTGH